MNKIIEYTPQGICSTHIRCVVEQNRVVEVEFTGGCPGNHAGISALIKGMDVNEAIARLEDIDCRNRGTSCPDQLAQALKEALK